MGKPAMAAPDRKMTAPDRQVMGTGNTAVAALCGLCQLPKVIATDLRERSLNADILDPWNKNTGCPTVVTGNLSLVRHRLDDLVCDLPAVIAVSTVPRKDETVAHGR
jgi:hypothetical protein